ncbi:MAG: hypothetical protein GC154_17255 [bacterium]|nr:hypothetical protein [bacterium]
MKPYKIFAAASVICLICALIVSAQITQDANFDFDCINETLDPDTLLNNGDFELASADGQLPFGWSTSQSPAVIKSQLGPLTDDTGNFITNHYAEFEPGDSLVQVPNKDSDVTHTWYKISFCADIRQGQMRVFIGDNQVLIYPGTPSTIVGKASSKSMKLNYSTSTFARINTLKIVFDGDMNNPDSIAYIDNIQLVPAPGGNGGDETPTPSPTGTPFDTPTPRNTPTAAPTAQAGTPTPTPTPKLTAESVQVIANPPMLQVSPDDFISQQGAKKQSFLSFRVIGSNGQPIPITAIDPNATIEFRVDETGDAENVGLIRSFEIGGGTNQDVTNRQSDVQELLADNLAFVPLKPYNGTVKVVVDVEFESMTEGRKEKKRIRGVAPIVMRTDPASSLTDPTGQFNPAQNYRLGRSPGDRGFRPDQRTNLFFRERSQ